MRVAEASQDAARTGRPQLLDQLSSQDAERDRVEDEGALPAEAQNATLRFELKELPEIEVGRFIDLIVELSFR
jgi:hypothetical protein